MPVSPQQWQCFVPPEPCLCWRQLSPSLQGQRLCPRTAPPKAEWELNHFSTSLKKNKRHSEDIQLHHPQGLRQTQYLRHMFINHSNRNHAAGFLWLLPSPCLLIMTWSPSPSLARLLPNPFGVLCEHPHTPLGTARGSLGKGSPQGSWLLAHTSYPCALIL